MPKSKLAKFMINQKFDDNGKILQIEGFHVSKTGDIFYYIKGNKNLVSEDRLSKLKNISQP